MIKVLIKFSEYAECVLGPEYAECVQMPWDLNRHITKL
jgi:hypothetical protein